MVDIVFCPDCFHKVSLSSIFYKMRRENLGSEFLETLESCSKCNSDNVFLVDRELIER